MLFVVHQVQGRARRCGKAIFLLPPSGVWFSGNLGIWAGGGGCPPPPSPLPVFLVFWESGNLGGGGGGTLPRPALVSGFLGIWESGRGWGWGPPSRSCPCFWFSGNLGEGRRGSYSCLGVIAKGMLLCCVQLGHSCLGATKTGRWPWAHDALPTRVFRPAAVSGETSFLI